MQTKKKKMIKREFAELSFLSSTIVFFPFFSSTLETAREKERDRARAHSRNMERKNPNSEYMTSNLDIHKLIPNASTIR